MEKETTGLYLTGHPMDEYREAAQRCHAVPIGAILGDFSREGGPEQFYDGQKVVLAGVVLTSKTRTTRNNSLMAYVNLEDDTGSMELLVFSKTLAECGPYLKENTPIAAEGRISVRDEKAPQLMCDRAWALGEEDASAAPARVRKIYLRLPGEGDPRWERILRMLLMFPGGELLKAKFADTGRWSPAYRCAVHPALVGELQALLGKENVALRAGKPEPVQNLPGEERFL